MRRRSRAFKLSRAVAGRGRLAPLHSALWLRFLSPEDLNAITMDSYSARARSGFETAAHNLDRLWPWEEAAAAELAPASHILVAGAGGGREMIALARKGHAVTGFDASSDLVDACCDHLALAGVRAEIRVAPPGMVPDGLGRFDAILIGRGSFHHFPRSARRIAFLRACRGLVEPGAPLLIGDFMVREVRSGGIGRLAGGEAGDFLGSAFFHRFTRAEMEVELKQAGFALVEWRATPFPGDGQLAHATAEAR